MQPTIDLVKQCVLTYFGLSEFRFKSRAPIHVWPRFVGMYLVNKHGASLRESAWNFGGKDHGACLHAKKRVRDSMDVYPETRKTVEDIEAMINERNHGKKD
jgi:chromosomal replication initiation ATPase DnaA